MNLIISVTVYGIEPKSLGIPCDICKDMSGRLVLPFLEENRIGNTFSFHTSSNKEMFWAISSCLVLSAKYFAAVLSYHSCVVSWTCFNVDECVVHSRNKKSLKIFNRPPSNWFIVTKFPQCAFFFSLGSDSLCPFVRNIFSICRHPSSTKLSRAILSKAGNWALRLPSKIKAAELKPGLDIWELETVKDRSDWVDN